MSLSRVSVRGFQACRSVLTSLSATGATRRRGEVDAGPSRTLFGRRVGEARGRSQSKVLSQAEAGVFELQIHNVKPECMDDYIKESGEHLTRVSESPEFNLELLGAWTTAIGPSCDESILIWKYRGYDALEGIASALKKDKGWNEFRKMRNKMLYSRSHQIILPFTFWTPADPKTKDPKGLYEMRTYSLKPGTLIEWGQWWEQGIQYRKDESVGGWFSQIGIMHQVHHLWAYKDLQNRSETRQAAWEFPGWDECVLRTGLPSPYMDRQADKLAQKSRLVPRLPSFYGGYTFKPTGKPGDEANENQYRTIQCH